MHDDPTQPKPAPAIDPAHLGTLQGAEAAPAPLPGADGLIHGEPIRGLTDAERERLPRIEPLGADSRETAIGVFVGPAPRLVVDDGYPARPLRVDGRAVVVTVRREAETRPWWMRLLGVYPPSSVAILVREEDCGIPLSQGTLAHGAETSITIRLEGGEALAEEGSP